MTRPWKNPGPSGIRNPGSFALEAHALTTRPTRRLHMLGRDNEKVTVMLMSWSLVGCFTPRQAVRLPSGDMGMIGILIKIMGMMTTKTKTMMIMILI